MNGAGPRRRSGPQAGNWGDAGESPGFLAAMLCVVCVMALFTLISSAEKRHRPDRSKFVVLAGVPERLIPLQIRCMAEGISWLDANRGQWHRVRVVELAALLDRPLFSPGGRASAASAFRELLRSKVRENARFSFLPAPRMNVVLLWIQPDGVGSAELVQRIIAEPRLPLRVGLVPVLANERIRPHATVPGKG